MQAGLDRHYSVEVFDGLAAQSVRVGVTTMVVRPPATAPSATCDVALELLENSANTVKVSTQAGSTVVAMVATDDELRFIKASLDTAD
jgi:hypothetical protein